MVQSLGAVTKASMWYLRAHGDLVLYVHLQNDAELCSALPVHVSENTALRPRCAGWPLKHSLKRRSHSREAGTGGSRLAAGRWPQRLLGPRGAIWDGHLIGVNWLEEICLRSCSSYGICAYVWSTMKIFGKKKTRTLRAQC